MNLTAIKEAFATQATAQAFLAPYAAYIILILIFIIIWDSVWKLISMWRASKRNSKVWFVILALVNSLGILPILYLIFTRARAKKEDKQNIESLKEHLINGIHSTVSEAMNDLNKTNETSGGQNEETNQLPALS